MRRMLGLAAAALLLALGGAACGDDEEAATPAGAAAARSSSGKIAVLLPDTKSSDRWEKADRRFFGEAFRAAGSPTTTSSSATPRAIPRRSAAQAEQADHRGREGDPAHQPRLRERRGDHRRVQVRRA